MKNFKRFTAATLALVMTISSVIFVSAASPIRTPEEEGYSPVRATFEAMGAAVDWHDETRSVYIDFGGLIQIVLHTDDSLAVVNGNSIDLRDGIIFFYDSTFISQLDLVFLDIAAAGGSSAVFELTAEARDIALYDFDHMVQFTLENSVWDNIIYRRLGINFHDHVARTRAAIYNMTPKLFPVFPPLIPLHEPIDARAIAANYLLPLLIFDFSMPLEGIGHLGPRDLMMYEIILTAFYQGYHLTDEEDRHLLGATLLNLEQYLHPSAVWFYGEFDIDLDAEEHPFPDVPGNIATEIIVPGEVAYLRIHTFMANPYFDEEVFLPFLQEVQDYNHLIIDLRSNMGGLMNYFPAYVFTRLLAEPIASESWEFYTGGARALAALEATMPLFELALTEDPEIYGGLIELYKLPIEEFLAIRELPYFNQQDRERFAYAIFGSSLIVPAEDSIAFDGKIWMLIDGMTASASSLAALTMDLTGKGTLVGENTSGVMAALHAYIALPNTGIIWRVDLGHFTDAYGRSLEAYGIAPHVRNREGLDALGTVLALIAEGDY
ncbi:MAG: hypothetical protein LBE35_05690 [Clostridiales bacterium]|jgi:hypothetical protein|nr:hypothetical protein [Clostridiales bacterium]